MPTRSLRAIKQVLLVGISALILMLLAIELTSQNLLTLPSGQHQILHLVLEIFSVLLPLLVAIIAWNTLSGAQQNMAKALVFGFSCVACIDMLHAISYPGISTLQLSNDTALSLVFWMLARSFEAFTLLLVASQLSLRGDKNFWLIMALLLSAGLFGAMLWARQQGLQLDEQSALQAFRTFTWPLAFSELFAGLWLLYNSRQEEHPHSLWLALAAFLLGVGELAFINQHNALDPLNLLGHLYKVAAYALIFHATFLVAVRDPYRKLMHNRQQLREQRHELDSLLHSMPSAVARFDRSLNLRYANPALIRMLGLDIQSAQGQPVANLLLPRSKEGLLQPLIEALGGAGGDFDLPYQNAQGEPAWALTRIVVEHNSQGEACGVLLVMNDNTERVRARQQLQKALQEITNIKTALDAHAIVAITNARGVIVEANDKFCEISQYSREELIGKTHKLINSGQHPKGFFAEMWRTISHGQVWYGEICNRAKDGSLYWVHTTIMPTLDEQGRPQQYIAIRADITPRKQAEQQAARLARHDPLTGLPNRLYLLERLQQVCAQLSEPVHYGALLLLDLDNFKETNNVLGHSLGDELLKLLAQRLHEAFADNALLGRQGGDEFVLIFHNLGSDAALAHSAIVQCGEQLRTLLNEPFVLPDNRIRLKASLGAVLLTPQSPAPEELFKQADMALYQAKEAGRNRLQIFASQLEEAILDRLLLLRDLRQALNSNQLRLHYQPLVDSQRHIQGVEALLRWQHPTRGMVPPGRFIALAEQTELISTLGQWVLETACRQIHLWSSHPQCGQWSVAVNVSAKQFAEEHFVHSVHDALTRQQANPQRLRIELTESLLQRDIPSTIEKMTELRRIGVSFSLDDFGTGYSSLSYLRQLPFQVLKLDKSFVDDLPDNEAACAITHTVIDLANALELKVVAEGVETEEQFAYLKAQGCQVFQGYLFAKPQEAKALESLR